MTISKKCFSTVGFFAVLLGFTGFVGQVVGRPLFDKVRLGCASFTEFDVNRSPLCVAPGINCQQTSQPCIVEGNTYNSLSRNNFIQYDYSKCQGVSNYVCKEDSIASPCMEWMGHEDSACNTPLCPISHNVYFCTVGNSTD